MWSIAGVAMQVRVMPNMPCLIRQAASAFVMGNHTNQGDLQRVIMLLSSVGETLLSCWIPSACLHCASLRECPEV